ncbi:MAG TPA: 1-deoxy-D-xylulose-5-phosphate synthase, partial [Thermodesulfovibrionales bacterium]|nr:1-deoxy-D-xylulose-5-phosphate synthase [Thermodesulfovibrionales bacterium]
GILEGRDKRSADHKVIAVIGDGALGGGLAFEGLNNAGHLNKDLIVVLNDNEMSISPNVGALHAYLNRILTGELYQKFRRDTKYFLESIPKLGGAASKIAQKTEEMLKMLFLPGIIFEELGFNYVGPIDGHNIDVLIGTLKRIKSATGPTLVHIITKKGKGYEFSEKDPALFHGIGPFEPDTGSPIRGGRKTYSEAFGEALVDLAEEDYRIVAITAAMKEGTGLERFAERFPERFYDVGIAEQHAVTFAAGLATQGVKPVIAIYSTFLQRAYDQIVHDVCLQNLHVVFAIDRAGIAGEDGPTHQGVFDISFLRHIPNMVVMEPRDEGELKMMLRLSLRHDGPVAIRYPRGKARTVENPEAAEPFEIGEAQVVRKGKDVAVIALGSTVETALAAAARLEREGVSATVVNARFSKPLDRHLIATIASSVPRIVTIEENVLQGGFGSAVLEYLHELDMPHVRVRRIGIPDVFIEQGTQAELRKKYGLDEEGIYQAVLSISKEPTYTF